MKSLSVTIPRPPSVNKLFYNAGRNGRARTAKYKAWLMHAGLDLNRQTQEKVAGHVSVRIVVNKKTGDLDNLCKPVLDLLAKHGLMDDDRNVVELFMKHSETMGENCSVTVEQVAA